jgi:predicted dehydrogenase
MGSKRLRVGVAGLGFGASVHVPGLRGLSDVEVVAIAGGDLQKTRQVAANLSVPKAVAGIEQLIEEPLDAVTFALPPCENEHACRLALEKGLPVLSEKPLACTGDAAMDLARIARGIPSIVNFQFIELAAFQRLKQLVSEESFGKVRHVQITWMTESYAQKHRLWSWKTDASRCGGVTTLLGSHLIFLLEWVFGPITELLARTSCETTKAFAPPGSSPADDLVHLSTVHDTGIRASATYGNACPGGLGHRWEVVSDKGTVTLWNSSSDYMKGFRLTFRNESEERVLFEDDLYSTVDGRLKPFRVLAHRFFDAVGTGERVYPDFVVAAGIQQHIDRIKFVS